jgi:hypothetical protein
MTTTATTRHITTPRMRRTMGALVASAAVAVGGVAFLPAGTAEAAGIHPNRITPLVLTTGESSPTTVESTTLGAGLGSTRLKLRVTSDGRVVEA